jgi:hypothetical protein
MARTLRVRKFVKSLPWRNQDYDREKLLNSLAASIRSNTANPERESSRRVRIAGSRKSLIFSQNKPILILRRTEAYASEHRSTRFNGAPQRRSYRGVACSILRAGPSCRSCSYSQSCYGSRPIAGRIPAHPNEAPTLRHARPLTKVLNALLCFPNLKTKVNIYLTNQVESSILNT